MTAERPGSALEPTLIRECTTNFTFFYLQGGPRK